MKQAKKKVNRRRRIPQFKSHAEEAKFWETHSLADYWDEFKPVRARFAKNLSEVLPVRFDVETLEQLRAQAQKKGLGPTQLVRMWVLERLQMK